MSIFTLLDSTFDHHPSTGFSRTIRASHESMGSVLVPAMVQEGFEELSSKKLHPFFSKGPCIDFNPNFETDANQPASTSENIVQDETSETGSNKGDGGKKRRKSVDTEVHNGTGLKKSRRTKDDVGQQQLSYPIEIPASGAPHEETTVTDFPTPPLSEISTKLHDQQPEPGTGEINRATTLATEPSRAKTPPKAKKVLQFNTKTGTLGSPPKPKKKTPPSRIVSIKYGHDEVSRKEIGDRITQILASPPQPSSKIPAKKRGRATKKTKEVTTNTSSATHPFFTGKVPKKVASTTAKDGVTTQEPPPPRQSIFMSTPMSPKKSRVMFNPEKMPQFGVKTGLTKVPGAMQPLWPAKGMNHVRGLDSFTCAQQPSFEEKTSKKSKGSIVTVSPHESIIYQLCQNLNLTLIRDSLPRDPDKFEPVPKELRMPDRHFESGSKLRQRMRPQLKTYKTPASNTRLDSAETDDFSEQRSKKTHSAIDQLYKDLEKTLSAFDRSTCEIQAWTQKYSPTTAAQILQVGKEGILLKEWLEALRIQSVDKGDGEAKASKGKAKTDAAPRKRRKKNKLDGFIVDSDEEANMMDEVSENEDDWTPSGPGLLKKTVIRSGDTINKASKEQLRLTNAAVISGPHGCGKTAAVYAIAKELGFEIFEINSSSRRSGKDILEKVGDMTRNHLVQHHQSEKEVTEEIDDEVARDLKSGKQGMMTAFFKPKTTTTIKKAPAAPAPTEQNQPETPKHPVRKSQKQSLILLEEVDVLYEEDKQFWTTLTGLIAQSRRPFIMTCTDESLVPLLSLNLHGIFRFTPPPVDLAADLCLLVAANEGHALQREAVEALYLSRGNDLRATLTELNYWCQLGVGDRRGGFDWFYPRWPKGSDQDEDGQVIRVISGDTYRHGMGFFGRDLLASCSDPLEVEDEAIRQSWSSWGVDAGDWNNSLNLEAWAHAVKHPGPQNRRNLEVYGQFCDSMSDADICSVGAFGANLQEQVDATLPEMPVKMKDDFILGRRLLEANPKVPQAAPHRIISMSLQSLARNELFEYTDQLTMDTAYDAIVWPQQLGRELHLKPVAETGIISILQKSFNDAPRQLARHDLFAFDPIAAIEKNNPSAQLDPSVFDRTTKLIVLDVAPWVRGIVEYDNALMQARLRLSNLLSEGGKRKRMRTTRAAYSALEGGERRTTRREKYFGDALNTELVRRTGGEGWYDAVLEITKPRDDLVSIPSSPPLPSSPISETSILDSDYNMM